MTKKTEENKRRTKAKRVEIVHKLGDLCWRCGKKGDEELVIHTSKPEPKLSSSGVSRYPAILREMDQLGIPGRFQLFCKDCFGGYDADYRAYHSALSLGEKIEFQALWQEIRAATAECTACGKRSALWVVVEPPNLLEKLLSDRDRVIHGEWPEHCSILCHDCRMAEFRDTPHKPKFG